MRVAVCVILPLRAAQNVAGQDLNPFEREEAAELYSIGREVLVLTAVCARSLTRGDGWCILDLFGGVALGTRDIRRRLPRGAWHFRAHDSCHSFAACGERGYALSFNPLLDFTTRRDIKEYRAADSHVRNLSRSHLKVECLLLQGNDPRAGESVDVYKLTGH